MFRCSLSFLEFRYEPPYFLNLGHPQRMGLCPNRIVVTDCKPARESSITRTCRSHHEFHDHGLVDRLSCCCTDQRHMHCKCPRAPSERTAVVPSRLWTVGVQELQARLFGRLTQYFHSMHRVPGLPHSTMAFRTHRQGLVLWCILCMSSGPGQMPLHRGGHLLSFCAAGENW